MHVLPTRSSRRSANASGLRCRPITSMPTTRRFCGMKVSRTGSSTSGSLQRHCCATPTASIRRSSSPLTRPRTTGVDRSLRRNGRGAQGAPQPKTEPSYSPASSYLHTAIGSRRCYHIRAFTSSDTAMTFPISCGRAMSSSCLASRRATGSSVPRRSPAARCRPFPTPAPTFAGILKTPLSTAPETVAALTEHVAALHGDRALLARLRQGALATAPDATWT